VPRLGKNFLPADQQCSPQCNVRRPQAHPLVFCSHPCLQPATGRLSVPGKGRTARPPSAVIRNYTMTILSLLRCWPIMLGTCARLRSSGFRTNSPSTFQTFLAALFLPSSRTSIFRLLLRLRLHPRPQASSFSLIGSPFRLPHSDPLQKRPFGCALTHVPSPDWRTVVRDRRDYLLSIASASRIICASVVYHCAPGRTFPQRYSPLGSLFRQRRSNTEHPPSNHELNCPLDFTSECKKFLSRRFAGFLSMPFL
jgi:hypothetical protein